VADKELETVPEMTFLLFLASLAALEYVVRQSPSRPERSRRAEPPETASAEGLHSLAQAIEQHGRGEPVERTETSRTKEELSGRC
jgi:hypothetical protein